MIVFCDTSALMKLYAQEQYSDWTRQQVLTHARCIVSQITWVEMCAALALKGRTDQLSSVEVGAAMDRLTSEWGGFSQLTLDNSLIHSAGQLAMSLGLRAYNSVQLACAQRTRSQVGSNMRFLCFDKQLTAAASALGILTLEP